MGLVPAPPRSSKRRCYDASVIGRIRIIRLARDAGFSISETRAFLTDYPLETTPSVRWRAMARQKMAELDALTERVSQMRSLLDASFRCNCRELRDCERLLVAKPQPRFD